MGSQAEKNGVTSTKPKAGKPNQASSAIPKQVIKCFFRKFDVNGDGRLSFLELKNAFKKLGVKVPFWMALLAINRADENGDGHISEHELDALAEFVIQRGITIPPNLLGFILKDKQND